MADQHFVRQKHAKVVQRHDLTQNAARAGLGDCGPAMAGKVGFAVDQVQQEQRGHQQEIPGQKALAPAWVAVQCQKGQKPRPQGKGHHDGGAAADMATGGEDQHLGLDGQTQGDGHQKGQKKGVSLALDSHPQDGPKGCQHHPRHQDFRGKQHRAAKAMRRPADRHGS